MPVLSTFARLFWAAVIFLAGWNKERHKFTWNVRWKFNWCSRWAKQSLEFEPIWLRTGGSQTDPVLVLWTSTHFSHKVCAVEFGVIFSSLHRFVWKFPLLANRVRVVSSTCSRVSRVTRDGITSSLNAAQNLLVPWTEAVSLLGWWSLVTWEAVEEECWHACMQLMVAAYACWMCEPTLSVCRELCWGLQWCTPISDHVHSEGSLLFYYNDRNKSTL